MPAHIRDGRTNMNQANESETKVGHASHGIDVVIIDPFGEIRRAKERKDWFAGLSASATYFEYWGTIKLKGYFKFHGIGLEKTGEVKKMFGEFIDRLGVRRMIELLYWFGIIDEPMYNQMKEVNRERNKLIHPQTEGIGYRFQDEEHFRNLLDQASHCIETLQTIRFE
jgi:hypothetical protein